MITNEQIQSEAKKVCATDLGEIIFSMGANYVLAQQSSLLAEVIKLRDETILRQKDILGFSVEKTRRKVVYTMFIERLNEIIKAEQ